MLKVVLRETISGALGIMLWASAQPAALAQPMAPVSPWKPATVDAPSLSLLEAARLTLAHQPNIHLSEADAALNSGILMEESGRFDPLLAGELSFRYDRRELRQADKKNEEDKREARRDAIRELEEQLAEVEQGREEIVRRQGGDTTSPLSDLELEAALDLIDAELEEVTDPDARQRLLDLRERTLQTALERYDEVITELRDSLTDNRERLAALGPVPRDEETYQGRSIFQYVLPLRNGLTVAPYLEYTLDGDRFVGKPVDELRGGKGIPDAYRAMLGFTLDVPLGRGFGAVSAAAREATAKADYEGRVKAASHTVATSLAATGIAYWDAAAAAERLKVLEASVSKQKEVVGITGDLVSVGYLAKVDLTRARGQQATAEAALDQARREDLAARIALAQAAGLNVRDAEPPGTSDPLPDLTGLEIPGAAEIAGGPDRVLAAREDLAATRLFVEAAGFGVRAAEHDLRPRVDLSTRIFANSFAEVSGSEALSGRWIAPSYDLDLRAEHAVGNRTQKGRLLQVQAAESLQVIRLGEQERRVLSDIVELAGGLKAAQAEARAARLAVDGYREAMEAEMDKLGKRESSLLDVLLTEQRWTEARLAMITSQRDAAQLLTRLRFATGTLISGEGESRTVDTEVFTTLPASEPAEEQP